MAGTGRVLEEDEEGCLRTSLECTTGTLHAFMYPQARCVSLVKQHVAAEKTGIRHSLPLCRRLRLRVCYR